MRDYIFHGKRVDNGEWVEGCLIHQGKHCLILQDESKLHPIDVPYINDLGCIDGYATPVVPESVGQYTGMKDITDQRIFEGDIMETAIGGITYHRGVVEFADGAFGLRCADGAAFFLCFVAGNYKKIGTVFENANLLEG